jgi:anti-sigma-K factor RskA
LDVHDLTPAYALHALDDVERERYEAHLAQCEPCREELAMLTESAAALAWAVESPAPPAELRSRILAEAGAGRDNVVSLHARRRVWPSIAAVAACAAVGLGIWAGTLNRTLHHERASAAQVVALHGRTGMVAVTANRDAVLVVGQLPSAPAGMTYEAWVIPKGGQPQAAGTFTPNGGTAMVHLGMKVPRGAVVAATIERAPGATAPTSTPILSAQT